MPKVSSLYDEHRAKPPAAENPPELFAAEGSSYW